MSHPLTLSPSPLELSTPRDYWELMKPRVMSLSIFTSLVGMVMAPGALHPFQGFLGILAIALGSGGAGALNMWFEARQDGLMRRTRNRPLPRGVIADADALAFGVILSFLAVLILGLSTHFWAAFWLAFTIFFYAVVYTMWLKPATDQNIVWGGLAGALPPLIGWSMASPNLTWMPLWMVAVIFLWTPPHFWALAILQVSEYAKAGFPMMPVTQGIPATQLAIRRYSFLLVIMSMLPSLLSYTGVLYTLTAFLLNVGFLVSSFRLARSVTHALSLFKYSILYLFLLFLTLALDHVF